MEETGIMRRIDGLGMEGNPEGALLYHEDKRGGPAKNVHIKGK